MTVTLIITTYNWKEALALSLASVLDQEVLPLEVIVADDGSRPDTGAMIRELAARAPLPIHHCWQEDKGFRLARSRNRAIARARGEYIVLIDGDIILERHFIADHLRAARPGYFVQGTRVLLNQWLTTRVLSQGYLNASFCSQGVENRKNCLRSTILSRFFSLPSRRLPGVKTCNFAFWREHAIQVNGFNEEFVGWGREDSEFVARLMNRGIRRRNLKFNGLAYHLYHPINARNHLERNDAILERTIREQLTWCEQGLNAHLCADDRSRCRGGESGGRQSD